MNNNLPRPDRIALVTGASSGLGESITHQIVTSYKIIIAIDLDESGLDRLSDRCSNIYPIKADVRDINFIKKRIQEILGRSLITDAFLVAGVGKCGLFDQIPADNLSLEIDVNFSAKVMISHYLLSSWRQNDTHGKISFVGSSTSLQPLGRFALYSASQGALFSFSRALIQEFRSSPIDINHF